MIQRIQTVYLAIALILLGLMTGLPLGEISSGSQVYSFTIKGIVEQSSGAILQNGWPLILFIGIVVLLQLVIIFSFKNRIRQMRMATYNIILMVGVLGISWFFAHSSVKELSDAVTSYSLPLAFPIVAAILNYLAIRAIGRDEALVKSIDRIR